MCGVRETCLVSILVRRRAGAIRATCVRSPGSCVSGHCRHRSRRLFVVVHLLERAANRITLAAQIAILALLLFLVFLATLAIALIAAELGDEILKRGVAAERLLFLFGRDIRLRLRCARSFFLPRPARSSVVSSSAIVTPSAVLPRLTGGLAARGLFARTIL